VTEHPPDQPEPEDALTDEDARARDHERSDADDREVPLDEPTEPDPPVDDVDGDAEHATGGPPEG
jgi:hypothetical protein